MHEERAAVKTLPRRGTEPGRGAPASLQDAFVLGRYRLLEAIGSGGHGSVWIARDENNRRLVAVKRIPFANADPQERVRIEREGRAAARLSHPAIVALFSIGDDRDAHYLVSELVEGASLARLYHRRAVTDRDLAAIGVALAGALEHAHERGVVHRDVKPANVIVPTARAGEGQPHAKLTDFGVASVAGEQPLTHTGDVIGTLAYMAPEQAEGRAAGPAADLYSLALTLYEGFAGENPLRGHTVAATARRIGAPIPSLRELRPDLPAPVCAVIDRALDAAAANRGTLSQLRSALDAADLAPRVGAPPRRDAADEDGGVLAPEATLVARDARTLQAPTRREPRTAAAGVRDQAPAPRPAAPDSADTVLDSPSTRAFSGEPATVRADAVSADTVAHGAAAPGDAATVAHTVARPGNAPATVAHAIAAPGDAPATAVHAVAPREDAVATVVRAVAPPADAAATAVDAVAPDEDGVASRAAAVRGGRRAPAFALSSRMRRLIGAAAAGVLCGAAVTLVSHDGTVAACVGAGAAVLVVAFVGIGWLLLALGAIAWLGVIGQPGTALIVAAGVAPVPVFLGARPWLWSLPALGPALGLVGLGGATPVLVGRLGGGPLARAALAALSYWWLALAEVIAGRRLLLGAPAGVHARASWQGSLTASYHHALTPLLSNGRLATAAVWALAALILPWVVRGPLGLPRALAAAAWAAALMAATIVLADHVGAPRPPLPAAVWALCAVLAFAGPVAARRRHEAPSVA